jgi:hypothetical protein
VPDIAPTLQRAAVNDQEQLRVKPMVAKPALSSVTLFEIVPQTQTEGLAKETTDAGVQVQEEDDDADWGKVRTWDNMRTRGTNFVGGRKKLFAACFSVRSSFDFGVPASFDFGAPLHHPSKKDLSLFESSRRKCYV